MTSKGPLEHVAMTLATVRELQNQLPFSEPLILSTDSICKLDGHFNELVLLAVALPVSTRRQLDVEGTKLWNICTQLMTVSRDSHELGLLSKVKSLAFAMLECAAPSHGPGNGRALEVALKTAKVCMDHGHLELSQKIVGTAAARLDALDKSKDDAYQLKLQSFTTEYYMLRVYLSWLQGRPDIAEHLFSKVPGRINKDCLGIIIDTCYKVGKSALSHRQYDIAAKWLEKASEFVPSDEPQRLGLAWKDKKLVILHTLVRSNLHLNTADAKYHLHKALDCLKTEYGDTFPGFVIQLESLARENLPNCQEYFKVLRAAIDMMEVNDTNIKIILHYIQKLRESNFQVFVEVMKQLLHKKLAPSDQNAWIEQILVSLIWVLTNTSCCAQNSQHTVRNMISKLNEERKGLLSEEATNACLILIWKHIDTEISHNNLAFAEQWCQLVLKQPMFQISPDNKAKFLRKLIVCSVDGSNTSGAYDIFNRLSEEFKSCPLTLYSMYKVALRDVETSQGRICLESLCNLGAEGKSYLMSCAAEAHQLGKARAAIESFQQIISNLKSDSLERVHVPILFHCQMDNTSLLNQVVSVLDTALKEASSEEQGKRFSTVELEWLSKKSYNIALELQKVPLMEQVVRLLDLSTQFNELYQQMSSPEENSRTHQHYLCSDLLRAVRIMTFARAESDPSEKRKHYTDTCKSTRRFQVHIQTQLDKCTTMAESYEWANKYRIMLSFDFEATVFLKQWDDLAHIVEESNTVVDDKLCSIYLDCILRSEASMTDIIRIVKKIICTFHCSPSPFLNHTTFREKLPRYLRCLFQLSINAGDNELAESVLDQVLFLAHDDPKMRDPGIRYPSDELQWLATMTFNRAVDFYLTSADENCQRWAESAIALADLIEVDDGALGKLLRQNFSKLS